MVRLHTNFGMITLELFADKAPVTVENFLSYVKEGFFDGTIFHRVIPGFMIQGGGFTADMEQKPTKAPIKNEANNKEHNGVGTISMARTSDPHSATCQFFINLAENDFLDFRAENSQGWGYCVFGQVTEGLDIVEKIATVKTGRYAGHADVPTEAVIIERVELNG